MQFFFLTSLFVELKIMEKLKNLFDLLARKRIPNETDRIYRIDHYNPSIRIMMLVSHIIRVMCVNSIHEWRDVEFTEVIILSEKKRNIILGIEVMACT